jgi:prepilin-type N-terminal cleavage/methylation domain-containing protein
MLNHRGHTLIEVLIVVIIIAVLAALAIPRYMYTTAVSRQKEAQMILKQIYELQRSYFQEYDAYYIPGAGVVASAADPNAFDPINLELMSSAVYSYSIEADGRGFVARAVASNLDDDPTPDIWHIDAAGTLVADSDDATQ